jgi:hypothetical protein
VADFFGKHLGWRESQEASQGGGAAHGLSGAPDIRDRARAEFLRGRQPPPDMERPARPLAPLAQRGIADAG